MNTPSPQPMQPFPSQYAAPGQVLPGNVSPYYGTMFRLTWQRSNFHRPDREPRLPVIPERLLVPFLLIIGVGAIVNSSSQNISSVLHITSEPWTTPMWAATPGRTTTLEKAVTPRTRPSSRPIVSLPQIEVPSLPSWFPSREWKDLPTTSDRAPTGPINHPVYKANYPIENCPTSLKGFKNREGHTAYYESLIACLQEVWYPHLTAFGVEQKSVDLAAYKLNVNTPCGSDNQNLTIFYCPSNTTIYVSQKKYEYDADCGQYVIQTATHEYFHHVQNQPEILSISKRFDADEMEVSCRIELQDICSTSHLQLTLNPGTTVDGCKSPLGTPLGDEEHGTKETIIRWKNRGFYMTTLQSCNTWGVSSREMA